MTIVVREDALAHVFSRDECSKVREDLMRNGKNVISGRFNRISGRFWGYKRL